MGAKALRAGDALIDLEPPHYGDEIALKRSLLERFPGEYYRGGPQLLGAQWEVLELVLEDLTGHYPEHFRLERRDAVVAWRNNLLDETHTFTYGDEATLPLEPLDWVGRQVQEDLVLVNADPDAAFVGGQLCFPNGWDLPDRLGKSFMDVHARTPQTTMPSVNAGVRLLSAMKPGKTVWRTSWNFKLTDQLDLSTKHKPAYKADFAARAPLLSAEAAGREIYVRVERQTFTRLRWSSHVLFGIHTYNSSLADEAADPERAGRILSVVRGTPEDVKRYKAISPIESAMTGFLEAASRV